MKTCYIYVRTAAATHLELSKGYGKPIARQIDECKNYAKEHGYNTIETFEDIGYSGNNYKRKSLQHLLAHCKKYSVDAVITLSTDRLSRSVRDFVKIRSKLNEKNIQLISVQEGKLSSSAIGELTGNIFASLAQWEFERSKSK